MIFVLLYEDGEAGDPSGRPLACSILCINMCIYIYIYIYVYTYIYIYIERERETLPTSDAPALTRRKGCRLGECICVHMYTYIYIYIYIY